MALGEDHLRSRRLQPPGGGWDLVGRPGGVGPGLEREKKGDRDRGEMGPDRDVKRKIETRVFTESDSESEKEREGEEDRERGR